MQVFVAQLNCVTRIKVSPAKTICAYAHPLTRIGTVLPLHAVNLIY